MDNTFTFNLHDTTLFGAYWKPQNTVGVIVLVHGMGEHFGRYKTSVIPHLIDKNFAVVTFDLFGHGKTNGKRGQCPSYEALLDAIGFVINKAENLFPNLSLYIYGHSLGGNLVINYTLKRQHNLNGVIASSPFLQLAFQPPKWKMLIGKLLLNIAPSLTLPSALDVKAISRDLDEVKHYTNDALVHDKVSALYTFPVIKAGEWAILNAHKLDTTMLVLHGTGDKITDYKSSVGFCKNSSKADIKLFENGYHELHHDTCKEEFMQTVLSWLENVN
nr:alpha/beta hydrolase [uncultured Psychroserpens sp.]